MSKYGDSRFMSLGEAAQTLGASRSTTRAWLADAQIEPYSFGAGGRNCRLSYDRAEVDRWIKSCRSESEEDYDEADEGEERDDLYEDAEEADEADEADEDLDNTEEADEAEEDYEGAEEEDDSDLDDEDGDLDEDDCDWDDDR